MKWLLIPILTLGLLQADPHIPTTIAIEPDATLFNSINVTTGDYYEGHADLTVRCAEPFTIHRVHVGADSLNGCPDWRFHSERLHIYVGKKRRDPTFWLTEASGSVVHFKPTGQWGFSHHAPLSWLLRPDPSQHFCNTSGGELSGKTFVGNYTLQFSRAHYVFTLTTGSGEKRTYSHRGFRHDWSRADREKNHDPKEEVFFLTKVVRSNGNRVLYFYDGNDRLTEIRSTDRTEKQVFGRAEFIYLGASGNPSKVVTSDGQSISYNYENINGQLRLKEVLQADLLSESYDYIQPGHVTLRTHQFENAIANEYDLNRRLVAQRITIGPKTSLIHNENSPVRFFAARAKLSYHNPGQNDGRTDVYDALGHLTSYSYNKERRLSEIAYYSTKGSSSTFDVSDLHSLTNQLIVDPTESTSQSPFGKKSFTWKGPFLARKMVVSEGGENRRQTTYTYDLLGNVVKENESGDLRGDKSSDDYRKSFAYSRDRFNNLVSASYDDTQVWTLYI